MPTVYNRRTESVLRGATTGGTDALSYTAINIVKIGSTPTTTDFQPSIDYNLSVDGKVDWSPLGAEPVNSATYYVTYDYYPEASLKTIDNIITEMRGDVRINNPLIDISEGEPTNDIFIEVPAKQIADVYRMAEHISLIQSLKNPDEFSTQELDDYAYNFNVVRKPATKSSGEVVFSVVIAPVADIVIPVGSQVSTLATTASPSVTFQVTTTTVLLAGTYSVLAPVESVNAGSTNNVGANSIVLISTPIAGISSVINPGATTGGTDMETNSSLAQRIIGVWTGANIGTKAGIQSLMIAQSNVSSALVQGWGDPLMVRDNGFGGKVDVYILAETGFTSSIADEEYTYSGGNIVLANQPVVAIDVVKVNNIVVPAGNYALVKDSTVVQESNRAQDSLSFIVSPILGDNIKVSYTYNSLINTLQALIDLDTNHIVTADVLIRNSQEVLINMTFQISMQPGYVFATVESSVATNITNFINAYALGSKILYSDIVSVARNTPGVLEVAIPFTLLARQGDVGASDITLTAKEYPRVGIITITEI